jgi:predicted RNase H-like HicB family nuclease
MLTGSRQAAPANRIGAEWDACALTVSPARLKYKARIYLLPRQSDAVIERDAEGYYVASVPQIRGCHTQARSLEAISLCLEVEGTPREELEFAGIQRVNVAA